MAKTSKSTIKAGKDGLKKKAKKIAIKKAATNITTKKKVTKKSFATKQVTSVKALPESSVTVSASGNCLTLTRASQIVQGCLPNSPHAPNKTLVQCGLISPDSRTLFRGCVFDRVIDEGCQIKRSQIPNGASTKVGEVITAVQASAN